MMVLPDMLRRGCEPWCMSVGEADPEGIHAAVRGDDKVLDEGGLEPVGCGLGFSNRR